MLVERPASHVVLKSILQRQNAPLSTLDLEVNIEGIFNLPAEWKAKIDDPAEPPYVYEVRLSTAHLKNAKVVPRELTEEEKAEAEAAKGKKGAPAKDNKKKGQEEEPSQEEKDRIEQERIAKEEEYNRRLQEWLALDDQVKFYLTSEDPFKEPSIKFTEEDSASTKVSLEAADLRDFEADINEK